MIKFCVTRFRNSRFVIRTIAIVLALKVSLRVDHLAEIPQTPTNPALRPGFWHVLAAESKDLHLACGIQAIEPFFLSFRLKPKKERDGTDWQVVSVSKETVT